ncbi:MAG TPA: Ig-like domain-containing protein, partial [Longimicrobiales bacterium]|nr:Ig-like domain-containing protein [Longimicrobiales bacterium]
MAGIGRAPWGRSLIAWLLALLLASGPALSCTEVDVTAVDIAMLEVEPQSLSLTVGDTARLSATLRDANGNELSGRAVTWTSSSPDIAMVDAGGRVAALASGTTVIEASSNGIRNEAMVVIGPRPQITVDRSTVGFTGRVGEAAPQPAEVTVRANGGGGLADLSTSIEYADGQPTGWLSASLSSRTAPATLTLTPSMSSLDDGRYIATVTVTSPDAGNSRTITVTFDVQERQPVITLDDTVVGFSATRGEPDPSPASINVSNAGGGTLNDLGASITYGAGTTENWLTAALSSTAAPAELTLSARIGLLAAGRHTATVMITSSVASNSPQTITVTFDVADPPPSIGVSTSSLLITATGGGPDPSPVGVAITNIGGGQLTGLAADVSHAAGEPTGWLTAALSRSDAPATLTVRATVAGLSVGTYTGTIQITAPGVANSPRSIQVTLVLSPAAASPEIGLSSTSLTFQATAGGSSPSAQTVNVTNTTGGTLDGLALSVSYPGGQPGGWLNASLGGGTAPTTITAQPVTGSLSAGTYGATIEVTSSQASNSPQT